MTYKVNSKKSDNCFSVPNIIADKHLRLASGEQIKVLLYILRKAPKCVTKEKIASKLKFSVSDVEDYLDYWILTGVLVECEEETKEDSQDSSKEKNKETQEKAEPEKYVPSSSKKEPETVKATKKVEYSRPTQKEVATRMSESAEICALLAEIEPLLGKTISFDGQCTFITMHDRFGLSPEIIFMLVQYCNSKGKNGYSYMEKVAQSWCEEEIDTIEKAANKIASLNKIDKFWKKFATAVGISTPKPTSSQVPYFEKWLNEYKMSLEMIVYAYEITVENISKFRISYTDKILTDWYKNKFKTVDDVKLAEKNKAEANKKKVGQKGASYDLDAFTEKQLNAPIKYEKRNKK